MFLLTDTTESLQLHTKALSLLREKVDDPTQHTSDGLIGGMSGFLIHDVKLRVPQKYFTIDVLLSTSYSI
jgi:hypothetical protein